MNGVISVIVPVYNVAAYLPQCVDSIIDQDYRNLQVILIDDGSTDESGAICDRYAEKDDRICVIHQENAGAAAAKNAGLRIATGEYLSFVDSDDYLDPGSYAYMVELLNICDADVTQCAYRDVFRNRCEDVIHKPGRSVFSGMEYLIRFTTDWTCGLMTDKLFRRGLYEGVFFEEGHKIDDEYFTYQGIMNANKVVCDDRIIYNYRRRASSVMLSPTSRNQIALDRLDYLGKRREKIIARFPELRKVFDIHYIDTLIDLSRDVVSSRESIREIQKRLKLYFREKGNTVPGVSAWPALVKLFFSDPDKLVAKCAQKLSGMDTQDYFA